MATQTSSETNEMLAELYRKAGIDPQAMQAEEAKPIAKPEEKPIEPSRTEQLLGQIAESLKPKPPEVKKPEPKTLSTERAFEIGLELQKGNVKVVDEYLAESGYLERALSEQGLNLESLKNAVRTTLSNEDQAKAASAIDVWLKKPGNDWPGGENNQIVMGSIMARMNLNTSDPESYQKAYDHMKSRNLVAGQAKKDPEPKKLTASSIFGAGAEHSPRPPAKSEIPTISRALWDKMPSAEKQAMYNDFVQQGFDPKDIKFVA